MPDADAGQANETIESTYLNPEETPLEAEVPEKRTSSPAWNSDAQVDEEMVEEELPGGPAGPAADTDDSDPFDDPFFTESRGGGDSQGDGYRQEEHTGQPQGAPAER